MFFLRLVSDYQFIGPEEPYLGQTQRTSVSRNPDVLKLHDVLTNFNCLLLLYVTKQCYIVFILYLSKVYLKNKVKLCVPQELTGITG